MFCWLFLSSSAQQEPPKANWDRSFQKCHAVLSLRKETKSQKCAIIRIFDSLFNSRSHPLHGSFDFFIYTWFKSRLNKF